MTAHTPNELMTLFRAGFRFKRGVSTTPPGRMMREPAFLVGMELAAMKPAKPGLSEEDACAQFHDLLHADHAWAREVTTNETK